MTTNEFLQIAPKITATGLFYNLKAREHGADKLGWSYFGSTENHHKILWRRYGTLANMVITETAESVNEILKAHDIIEFKAISTKSKRFCRLVEVK